MGKRISIQLDEYEIDQSRNTEELGRNWGVAHFIEKKIYIANDQPEEEKGRTLVHEFFELLKRHYRINARESDILKLEDGVCDFLDNVGFDYRQFLED